ncbi:MAG: hypothetical protein RL497_2358 [Pseudomonadota bacterium]|jgi:SAM-dependent methyltransferase
MTHSNDSWAKMADTWQFIPPPLRPQPDDVVAVAAHLKQYFPSGARGLILGVTPEYCHLATKLKHDVYALDISNTMINRIWPGPKNCATQGNWMQMPFGAQNFDWLILDGGFALLPHPVGQAAVIKEVFRILKPGGLFFIRLFTPPILAERQANPIDNIETLLRDGTIANVSQLKLWLWGTLQIDATCGIGLMDIARTLAQVVPKLDELLRELGWPQRDIDGLNAYNTNPARYYLTDEKQTLELLQNDPGGFNLLTAHRGQYAFAECCALLVLLRNG